MRPRPPRSPLDEAQRLARRLRRLSPAARRALRRAALLPQPFALAQLGVEGDEAEEASLTLFQEAVDLGLPLSEAPDGQLCLDPALRGALTAGLLPGLQAALRRGLRPEAAAPPGPPDPAPERPALPAGRLDGALLMGAPMLPAAPPGALDGAALAAAPDPLPWPEALWIAALPEP